MAPLSRDDDTLAFFLAHQGAKTIRLLAAVVGMTALMFAVLEVYRFNKLPSGATLPAMALTALILVLLRLGHARAATIVFLWGLAIIPLVAAVLGAGLSAPALFVLPVITMASTWLLGTRNGVIILLCSCAGYLGIAAMQTLSIPMPLQELTPLQVRSPMGVAIAFVGITVAAAVLGHATRSGFKAQFAKARGLAEDLSLQVQEIKKVEAKLRTLVYHDETTGLRSAHAQRERVRELLQQKTPFSLMSLNLDSFRLINDNFGTSFGNAIISAAGGVIALAVGESGELARAEGAEFTLLTVNLVDQELLKDLSNRILLSLRQPLNRGEVNIYSDVSIGISRFPVDASDCDELFRMAQLALHKAKERGGCGMCGYEASMNQVAQDNLWLDHNLRTAVKQQQLALHYQPKIRLSDNALTSVEALIRWSHPVRGNIPPDVFIPRAEVAGAIVPIGRWIISTAAQQAAHWQTQGHSIRIAINLSVKQLADNELVEHLRHAQQVANGHLDIELTETCLANNDKETVHFIEQCRSMGFGVHLDDFGTGYSSLARVAQLPLTMIKLDRIFVASIGRSEKADALLRAMVSICKELDLPMVAEGVETAAQARYLHSLGVRYAQGWLYAPAMAPDALAQWMQAIPEELHHA